MAKALIGYMNSDLRTPARLVAENDRLRARVGELEDSRPADSRRRTTRWRPPRPALLDLESAAMQEMQPA